MRGEGRAEEAVCEKTLLVSERIYLSLSSLPLKSLLDRACTVVNIDREDKANSVDVVWGGLVEVCKWWISV